MKRIAYLIAVAALTFAQGAWADVDSRAPRSLYETMEIAGHGPFPSQGGPIDGGD